MIPRDASFCERRTTQRRAVWVARHRLRIGSALLACPEQLVRMASRHLPFAILVSLLVVISPCRSDAGSERTTFFLSNEFFGPMGYRNPAAAWNFQNGMTNMLALASVHKSLWIRYLWKELGFTRLSTHTLWPGEVSAS